jgi:hypothetical protein
MTDVDKVALWAGLISSVIGIVLSIVAIVLSVVSNNRATAVNDQTIKSLQKIESAVERLADDSRTLIKAGWDKMLGNFGSGDGLNQAQCVQEEPVEIALPPPAVPIVTEGAAADEATSANERFALLENQLMELRRSLARPVREAEKGATPSQNVDILTNILSNLSPRAHALFDLLSRSRHLSGTQYAALEKSDIGLELRELRQAGLLVQLSGHGVDKERVYWLPTKFSRAAKVATQLAPRISAQLVENVFGELVKVGYSPQL